MTLDFSVSEDLFDVVDGLESVTWSPCSGGTPVVVEKALKRSVRSRSDSMRDDGFTLHEVVWYLPTSVISATPSVGDLVVGDSGISWMIIDVEYSHHNGYWRCVARDLVRAYGLDQHVAIERADVLLSDDGTETRSWRVWRSGVAASWGDAKTVLDESRDRQQTDCTATLLVGERFLLDHTYRVKTVDGTCYRVVCSRLAGKVGEPTEIDLQLES